MLEEFLKTLCWLLQRNPCFTNSGWSYKVQVDILILSPSLIGKFTQIYCQRKLWLLFLSDVQTKQLHDLRCCKSMQLEIGGLAAKNCFVHSFQKIANYFTGKSIYF